MSGRPAMPSLRLPRAARGAPTPEEFNNAMVQLERADSANLKTGTTPALPALVLTAADGSAWTVTVSATGVLSTVPAR